MSRGRVSSVYEYFDEQDTDFNCKVELEATGNVEICGKKITKLSEGGTISNLKRHLKRHHATEFDIVEKADLASKSKVKKTGKM